MRFCLFQQVCKGEEEEEKEGGEMDRLPLSWPTQRTQGKYCTGRVSCVQDSERDTQRGRLHKDNHYLTSSSLLWDRCSVF